MSLAFRGLSVNPLQPGQAKKKPRLAGQRAGLGSGVERARTRPFHRIASQWP